jgi:hypothetical protein
MRLTVVPATPDAEHWLSTNLRAPLASSNVRSVVSWIKSPSAD